ncbi:MAG: transposase [Bryobacteraceae bacterium]
MPALQKASVKTLRTFCHQHNCRSEERIQQRLDQIRQAAPVTTDAALLEAARLCIENCVRTLAQMRLGIQAFERRIAEIYRSHPDRAIRESFPGAGPALEPRLIAAVGSRRERFDSAHNPACFTGIAPVQVSSGNSSVTHWRWACPKFIRQTFHEWAACSIRTCEWARAFYQHQRGEDGKRKGTPAAIRALAYKWIRIFFRCWRDGVAYSAERYPKALQAHAAAAAAAPSAQDSTRVGLISGGGFSTLVKIS